MEEPSFTSARGSGETVTTVDGSANVTAYSTTKSFAKLAGSMGSDSCFEANTVPSERSASSSASP